MNARSEYRPTGGPRIWGYRRARSCTWPSRRSPGGRTISRCTRCLRLLIAPQHAQWRPGCPTTAIGTAPVCLRTGWADHLAANPSSYPPASPQEARTKSVKPDVVNLPLCRSAQGHQAQSSAGDVAEVVVSIISASLRTTSPSLPTRRGQVRGASSSNRLGAIHVALDRCMLPPGAFGSGSNSNSDGDSRKPTRKRDARSSRPVYDADAPVELEVYAFNPRAQHVWTGSGRGHLVPRPQRCWAHSGWAAQRTRTPRITTAAGLASVHGSSRGSVA